MKQTINGIFLTDVHMGVPGLPAAVCRENLIAYLYPLLTDEIDILFLGGDWFDTLLNLDDANGAFAVLTINEILHLAKEHSFYVRVVRGTFKHDRHQNKFFTNETTQTVLNDIPLVRVFNEITLEHIPSLDLDILYIPDEIKIDDLVQYIRVTLANNHLRAVDFIVHHGYFQHLIPDIAKNKFSNVLAYEDIEAYVKGAVFNGHVHTPSVYKKVINGGSFERTRHGEEEQKGFFTFTYDRKKCQYQFVENKSASWYKTFHYDANTKIEEFELWIDSERLDKFQDYHLRLVGDDLPIKTECESYVKTVYPNVTITTKSTSVEKNNEINTSFEIQHFEPITEANITDMIVSFLDNKLDKAEVQRVVDSIKE